MYIDIIHEVGKLTYRSYRVVRQVAIAVPPESVASEKVPDLEVARQSQDWEGIYPSPTNL